MVNITIDGQKMSVKPNITILQAAREHGIDIPTLCFLKEINEIGACRICVVEVEGNENLLAACNTKVAEGMVIYTSSPRVRNARRVNLRLILSQHDTNCTHCPRSGNCKLQKLANDYNFLNEHYQTELTGRKPEFSAPFAKLEDRCVKCLRCVQICSQMQTVDIWDLIGTGSHTRVGLAGDDSLDKSLCTYCGQCITHCPVGALQEHDDTGSIFDALADPDTVVVAQIAPAVRTAWAEYFGYSAKDVSVKHLVTALKKIGFDYVFDTDFGADLTIMEEATEFVERFTHKNKYKWPMLTSCCPGWVRFCKGQFPEFIDNMSTGKSPQQMFGAIIKTYFAKEKKIDPKKIFTVSIMPCVAKKDERNRPGMNVATGLAQDIDSVITTRELVRMLRGENINIKSLEPTPFDSLVGSGTGAGVVFGASGGVAVAALRTAYYLITGKNPDADAFKSIAGKGHLKTAEFNVPGAGEIKVAVVSGLGNTRALLEAVKRGDVSYDFIEVMACPGGCAGGGGQPIHDGEELANIRGDILWNIDKKCSIRFSHENPEIIALYDKCLGKPMSKKSQKLLHVDHHSWKMPNGK
ncbi:MAG: [FeFe] hydrogenase, group A [Lachnospiraceae bacterium]|nr:[FeFe] hydrogenase, group A [Candidatus Minthocola equi]